MVLTQQNSIKQVRHKQRIPLQATENHKAGSTNKSGLLNMWFSFMLFKTVGLADSNRLCPMCSPDGTTHCLSQIVYSSEILHKFGWFPPPIHSVWTILNDDHGDYVLVIPARSLKECPCCVLNTQWRDYADPYMWCCGCIPPVRLNPICYRFGLKKRGAASTRGWVEGCAVLYLCFTVHSTSSIS